MVTPDTVLPVAIDPIEIPEDHVRQIEHCKRRANIPTVTTVKREQVRYGRNTLRRYVPRARIVLKHNRGARIYGKAFRFPHRENRKSPSPWRDIEWLTNRPDS